MIELAKKSRFSRTLIIIILFFALFIMTQGSGFVIDAENNAFLHNNQGATFLKDGHNFAAINEFKIAISLSPDKPATASYFNNLGIAYNSIGKYAWAQDAFERAIELNPNFFEYYKNLVVTYKNRKTLQANVSKYRSLQAKDKENSYAWLFLGLIYGELGLKQVSAEYLNKFINLEPDLIISDAVKKQILEINEEYKL